MAHWVRSRSSSLSCKALLVAIAFVSFSDAAIASAVAAEGAPKHGCQRGTFKNFHNEGKGSPPPGYRGPTFVLSQSYPDTLPPAEKLPWDSVDVSKLNEHRGRNALKYLDALYRYTTEGNIDVGWVVQNNKIRRWYHSPWLDSRALGREYIHGLTHELDSTPQTLGDPDPVDKNKVYQTWAVGAFNERGAWAIGQMWCDPENPDPDALNPNQSQPNWMPNGTVIWKLLFSTADSATFPFLKDAYEWQANILVKPDLDPPNGDPTAGDPPRSTQTVRLVQMDLAVRDDRLPNGWAYGTYAYSNNPIKGSKRGATPWSRMVPIGLQWGNDPGITPSMVEAGTKLRESWLNPKADISVLPDNHRGWGGRLVGPLDNRDSSCMSCHQTAGQPAFPLVAPTTNKGKATSERDQLFWFDNTPAGVAFGTSDKGNFRTSTDYSLQLSMGLQYFLLATCDPAVLQERVSARGPSLKAPSELASTECPKLRTTATIAWEKRTTIGGVPFTSPLALLFIAFALVVPWPLRPVLRRSLRGILTR